MFVAACALAAAIVAAAPQPEARPRARDAGVILGVLPPGPLNAITDVAGVRVGHTTVVRGDTIRTGVTAVLPHGGNLFQQKVPGAVFVGAGTGTIAFGFKGGIGTSSRRLPGGWTVGVLVQTNFGGVLTIAGVPVGRELGPTGGSCVIVIATDAPVDARNLRRMAARAIMGMARTGAAGSNGSGDYAIAFSTAKTA